MHPFRLEGFPGAPIEPGLFEPKAGARWVFADGERELVLELTAREGALVLTGGKEGRPVVLRVNEPFVELVFEGQVIDRPFKRSGRVGDRWKVDQARYTVFGYDEIDVLGKTERALVVAIDRDKTRDLYWFAAPYGWVRIRTERQGSVVRDARLTSFEPGS